MSTISAESVAGGHGGHGGHEAQNETMADDAPLLADALVTNRDGIVGHWQPLGILPTNLAEEHVDNMALWSAERREQILDFEIGSRLGFSAMPPGRAPRAMTIWHINKTVAPGAPTAVYQPLAKLIRPPEATFLGQLELE